MDLASVACLERYRAHTENENNSHEKKTYLNSVNSEAIDLAGIACLQR
jgi:hypothetical protein